VRIVDPSDAVDEVGDLVIRAGRIEHRGPSLATYPEGAEILDGWALVATPGFVDLHTHLRYPGFPAKETLATGAAAAAAGGFTTVCAMANTDPVVDSVAVLRQVQEAAEREACVHVLQFAAVTRGLQGGSLNDMSTLAAAGAVGFSDDGKPVWDEAIMRSALTASMGAGRFISAHEEDPDLVAGGVANAGERARRLGLPEWPCSGEAAMVARDVVLAADTGGHVHIAHLSCADSIPIIREGKERGVRVTAEVTPHHLRLTDRLLDGDAELGLTPAHPCVKVNPPLRSEADVEALVDALREGVIDAIATDHAPHTEADKSIPFVSAAFGFSGLETALPLGLDLVRQGRMGLATLIRRLTGGPANVLGRTASVRPGSAADLCVFDPDEEWTLTPEALRSKGKNTPLLGARLRGRVRMTLVGGAVIHRLRW
jgi:dihydroorotase